jgi:hypothetical protein
MKVWGIQLNGMKGSGALLILFTLCIAHMRPTLKQIGPGLRLHL